jgi:hypothetical protein
MPLARIFTHHPERTTVLSEQLQQQGYRVEVVGPEQKHLAPADLEIEFETCERADVLDRAADLATQLEADVAVAPGVLQPQAVMESAAAPEAAVPQERDPEREFQAAFATPAELPAVEHQELPEGVFPEMVDVPVMEQAPLPPVAFMDEPAAKPADPIPYLAQLTPFGTPTVHAESEESVRADHEPWREAQPEVAQSAAAAPRFGQRGTSFLKEALGGARLAAASMAASLSEKLREYQKRAQVRSAEARAAREARLLDLEQRRAEAQERALELEAAREAAAARLVELVRQRDPGLREESLRDESLRAESLREESVREEVRRSAPVPAPLPESSTVGSLRHASIAMMKKVRRPMTPQLRAVLAGAAAVSALFIVGIVLGAFSPRAPLANPATHPSEGVTVHGGGVTVTTGGATVTTGPAAQAPVKAPQPAATAAKTQTPAATKPSPRVAQARQFAAEQAEDSGDDVTIRHFSRPVPTQKPKQAGQQAGLKHFSDLEN